MSDGVREDIVGVEGDGEVGNKGEVGGLVGMRVIIGVMMGELCLE